MHWKPVQILSALFAVALQTYGVTEISQYGITWQFDKDCQAGQFCNGDYWVIGPVKITEISNDRHKAQNGIDGSMINPPTNDKQGYDNRLNSFDANLQVSAPLTLNAGESLISSVSWIAGEPGCPKLNGSTKMPRPVLRAAAVLTCVDAVPPEGSFRPPYCGKDKTIRFNKKDLNYAILPKLSPVSGTPDLNAVAATVARPWIDHENEFMCGMIHPTENMPQYGGDLSRKLGEASLMLLLNFPADEMEKLMIGFVQIGIDLTGIADNGGNWPSNGGHQMGRKWPIMFAGIVLNDAHMKNAGQWETGFQEDLDTFYVSQAEVDLTHSSAWNPDKRASVKPYEAADIGLPEWGIRHTRVPQADNMSWNATYRSINNPAYVGWVLAARIMDQKKAWNHDALFDYVDRSVAAGPADERTKIAAGVYSSDFVMNMWKTYRTKYGPVWTPDDPSNPYSPGKLKP